MNVQFSDSGMTVVVSYFGGPQDPDEFPNQAEIQPDDPRWASFYNSLPPMIQRQLPAPTAS